MTDERRPEGNGFVHRSTLDAVARQQREDHNRDIDRIERKLDQIHVDIMNSVERNAGRIDRLESWRDRVAGPVAVILAALAIVATASNIIVIWLGVLS